MVKRLIVAILFSAGILCGEVIVYPDPMQQFNSAENYANRIVYFFLQKGDDGSVTVQIQPPPFYASDSQFLNSGIAYIDSGAILKTYTAAEVAATDTEDVTFSVMAYPNTSLAAGYNLYAILFQWMVNLDPKSIYFHDLQSINVTTPMGLSGLFTPALNEGNGELTIYSEILNFNPWLGFTDGVFLTTSALDSALFSTTEANTPTTQELTIRLDFTQIPNLATGTYSLYFSFQMNQLSSSQSTNTILQDYSDQQVVEINFLYNSIISVNSYLDGNNALYDPVVADQVILNANKITLIALYDKILAAMVVQWTAFAALPNLSSTSQTLVTSMLNYIVTAEANKADFAI